MPAQQSRFWLGTLHVPEMLSVLSDTSLEDTQRSLRDWVYDRYTDVQLLHAEELITAFAGQLELAPTPAPGTNGAHLQFYVVVPRKITLTGLKALLSAKAGCWNRCHVVVCTETERSLAKVKEYCYDDDKESKAAFVEKYMIGTFPSGSTGNQRGAELESLRERLVTGTSLRELVQSGDVPLAALSTHMRFIDRCEEEFSPKRQLQQDPVWIFMQGESGAGKTFWIEKGGLEAWSNGKYKYPDDVYTWTGHTGGNANWITKEATAFKVWHMVEMDGDSHGHQNMVKNLVDRGPCRVQGKGYFVECLAEVIITTSNLPLNQWWAKQKQEHPDVWERHMAAINRRFNEFGYVPNFRLWLRSARLAQRLVAPQGEAGPSAPPTRRISPVSVLEGPEGDEGAEWHDYERAFSA